MTRSLAGLRPCEPGSLVSERGREGGKECTHLMPSPMTGSPSYLLRRRGRPKAKTVGVFSSNAPNQTPEDLRDLCALFQPPCFPHTHPGVTWGLGSAPYGAGSTGAS